MIRIVKQDHRLNEALHIGDVIRFDIPFFNCSNGQITSINKNPPITHYAIIVGKTDKIGKKRFKESEAVKLTHYSLNNNPKIPFLDSYSFIPGKSDMQEVQQHFYHGQQKISSSPYSRPNEEAEECAVCSIHDSAKLRNYKRIGAIIPQKVKEFIAYYNSNKAKMNHLLVDKKGEPYLVNDALSRTKNSKYLMDANGNWVDRASIQESLEQQPMYVLLLVPAECFSYEDDYSEIDMPWIVRSVAPQDDYTLLLRFDDGKVGVYDMWPLIQQEDGGDDTFVPLEDIDLFMQAHLDAETVGWPYDISVATEELYDYCMSIPEYERWSAEEEED